MTISTKDWKNYISRLSMLDKKAGQLMQAWIQKHGFGDTEALIDYASALVTKYGEGSAALSAEMYDAIAQMQEKDYAPAVVADTPSRNEVAKAMNGVLKQSRNLNRVSEPVERLVKRTGADTTLKNAKRDGAQFAWVPSGDTCPFCITLASRGWQYMSENALRNGHAEHIHARCDCTYAIRFDNKSGVKGYDPQKYLDAYNSAEGSTPEEKMNSMRRVNYTENKDRINAQKRAAYAERTATENGELTNNSDDGIIQNEMYHSKDRSRSREDYNFISDKRFDDITIPARKNGAIILRGGEDVEQHLDNVGANAACLDDVLMFREKVTISEALEETKHFEQNINHMNYDKDSDLRTILNEIDAKQYILDNAKKYNIPQNEINETREQLLGYQQQLEAYRDV